MSHLKLVVNQPKPRPAPVRTASLYTGLRYYVQTNNPLHLNTLHGVIGDYRISSQSAEVVPVVTEEGTAGCYLWDRDIEFKQFGIDEVCSVSGVDLPIAKCGVKSNHLVLNGATLDGPEVVIDEHGATLTLTPRFDISFNTDCCAAQLGVIHLVNSKRFITLENGDEVVLLESGDDDSLLLYLQSEADLEPVKPICAPQREGEVQKMNYGMTFSQSIPDVVAGEAVVSLTVLEQYTSYFMQRIILLEEETIWTPIYAPVSWGWSIRVGRCYDGEWGILRRKVMLPTTGHEGLHLPLWSNNTVSCSISVVG